MRGGHTSTSITAPTIGVRGWRKISLLIMSIWRRGKRVREGVMAVKWWCDGGGLLKRMMLFSVYLGRQGGE